MKRAELHYPHHCCAFQNPEKQDPQKFLEFKRKVELECAATTTSLYNTHTFINHSVAGFWERLKRELSPGETKATSDYDFLGDGDPFGPIIENMTHFMETGTLGSHPAGGSFSEPFNEINKDKEYMCGRITRPDFVNIVCTPTPDALNPCEDVMGYSWLRVMVWFVLVAALLGNIIVLLVLVTSKGKMTVPKFLMCNLAFADLLMGIYLLLLASIDIKTLGEYFQFAILWQNEGGCQVAGFLTVFSSELSVYTLTVITLERWYAITHAIHLNKRLKIRQAAGMMAVGWAYAIVMGSLPIFGVSSYGDVSICLPMRVLDAADTTYILALLVVNSLAFFIVCASYMNMYWKVRGSDSMARSNDATIAKRMSLLVFTNFACWAPIAFFGLTASTGSAMISITNSKILLVFFYPLNSCANPFLYVILTKQFRKDIFILLSKYGICTEKANKYKGTLVSKSGSRKDSLALHNIVHPMNSSLLTQYTDVSHVSRNSMSLGSPPIVHKGQRSPEETRHSVHFEDKLQVLEEATCTSNYSQYGREDGKTYLGTCNSRKLHDSDRYRINHGIDEMESDKKGSNSIDKGINVGNVIFEALKFHGSLNNTTSPWGPRREYSENSDPAGSGSETDMVEVCRNKTVGRTSSTNSSQSEDESGSFSSEEDDHESETEQWLLKRNALSPVFDSTPDLAMYSNTPQISRLKQLVKCHSFSSVDAGKSQPKKSKTLYLPRSPLPRSPSLSSLEDRSEASINMGFLSHENDTPATKTDIPATKTDTLATKMADTEWPNMC